MRTEPTLYVIFADGDPDQICETATIAKREAADLRKMGFETKTKTVAGWEAAERLMDGGR
ncbi:hypothetical protein [Mesorhizobium denitrificans]|uniref:Uncharacterized protein n=1 Tax=Mesorhizobium denitrificans TaxID=2294114 RepID=A0A371XEZ7_9HYPH|nr:hypothetical protein [Mesorhizobium denitrificans]RFC67792.1 hypothetical protein DY251_09370 [Mesorhizobium denitrificans]